MIDTNNITLKDLEASEYVERTLGYPLEVLFSFPKFFLIETINVCNARCIMCGIDFDKKKKKVMSDRLFDKISNEISQYSEHINKVMLYLDCEPLLDRKFTSRIQKMKDSGIKRINIATNASLLNRGMAIDIINAGLDEIYITIDSLNKKTYEEIRKGLKFGTVYKNIIDFIQLRNELNQNLTIRIQMILQEKNANEADSFTSHWAQFLNPNDQVVVQKGHNWGATIKAMKFGDEDKVNNIPCIALWGTFCIHVDGKVGLCCMDYNTTMPIGDLVSQTIAEIWNGEPLNRIRQMHISGRRSEIRMCSGCTLWRDFKHYREKTIGKV